jgi:hypothetical protein
MNIVTEHISNIETNTVELQQFLEEWDKNYRDAVKDIPMFKPELTKNWTDNQKIYFAKTFYHVRGHFHDFLWYLGTHTADAKVKAIILENIAEEFGGIGYSHEQLYYNFAKSVGADLNNEIIKEENYLPFIRKFNQGHLEWLQSHNLESRLAAFSAYERLDNIDYVILRDLAKSLNVKGKGLIFFNVHAKAGHFDRVSSYLVMVWNIDCNSVKKAFSFIGAHQLQMWETLSNKIFCHV